MATTHPQPFFLPSILKTFSAFAVTVGCLDSILGTKMLIENPESMAITKPELSWIDSQVRFFGSIWAGYGIMLWWASNDLQARRQPLALLGGILMLAGVGRVQSGLKYGYNTTLARFATALEIAGPVLVYLVGFRG